MDGRYDGLAEFIGSKKALKGTVHAIERIEEWNRGYFPLTVRKIAILGSSLRYDVVNDIDLLLFVEENEMNEEFKEFLSLIEKNISILREMLFISEDILIERGFVNGKVKKGALGRMVEKFKDNLLNMGFKDVWLDNWLSALTFSDLESLYGLIPSNLLIKFVKKGWRTPKISMNIVREDIYTESRLAYIIIWENGVVKALTKKDIDEYLKDEHEKLLNSIKSIIFCYETGDKCDDGYAASVISIIKREEEPYLFLREEIKKIATEEIETMRLLINENGDLKEINKKMRKSLKIFDILPLLYQKMTNLPVDGLKKAENPEDEIKRIILRRMSSEKTYVSEILERMDVLALIKDYDRLKEIRRLKS